MKTILTLIIILFTLSISQAQEIPENLVLKRLDNTEVQMKDVLRKDVAILTFWATWCKPCQSELEALLDLEDEWKDKIRIIAVSIDDSRAVNKVKSLVKGKKWPYEILLDQNKELYKALNLTSIPFVMIVKEGETQWTHTGYTPGNEHIVMEKALELLK